MDVKFDYNDVIANISNELKKIPDGFEREERYALTKIGKVIKSAVEAELDVSDNTDNWKNYDGSMPYRHMRDDVNVTTKKDKSGSSYVVVGGGKLTAYKWHLVNDGTFDSKTGRRIPATRFIDNAMKKMEYKINNIVDELLIKVANGS
ncbi:HK97-gp10 family putative phage morphogenesis protein [Lachnoclostridium sp.]|uniref:HK97-gp10 family putative phage morphogenesis protein n=1 Tax=Lachnoclostridium sp. TaxID=2028282 RepID=UPI0026C19ACC|nr:HK97-gp10 family putative phage morphogenesis protein [Lachnoclostridium sp.]